MWRLAISGTGQKHWLGEGSTLLGRDPANDIVLVAEGVSRRHARLSCSLGLVSITDCGSRFGTRVNGEPLAGERRLQAGDVINVGVELVLEAEQPPAPAEAPEEFLTMVESELASNRLVHRLEKAPDASEPDLFAELFALTERLTQAPPITAFLRQLIDFGARVTGFEGGVALIRGPTGVYEPVARLGASGSFSSAVVKASAHKGSALLVRQLKGDARFLGRESVLLGNADTVLCVPLLLGGQVSGALYFSHGATTALSGRALEVVTALGHLGGLAMERSRLEAMSREATELQAQKLEAVGRLAGGVAHELNTPLQYISDNLAYVDDVSLRLAQLLEALEQHPAAEVRALRAAADVSLPEVRAALQAALEGVDRVARIVKAMKDYARGGDREQVLADVNALLTAALERARPHFFGSAAAHLELQPLPQVRCAPTELEECFFRLVVNAAHAITDAGRAQVGTIRITSQVEGGRVVLRISDDGVGIPEGIRQRVWEPFFTTKEVGRGTGHGLTLARSAVEALGGTLSFETEVGKGTTFTATLPSREEPASEVSPRTERVTSGLHL